MRVRWLSTNFHRYFAVRLRRFHGVFFLLDVLKNTFELRALGPSRRRSSAGDREDQPLLRFPTARFELHKMVRVSGQRFRRIVTSMTSVKDIIHSK